MIVQDPERHEIDALLALMPERPCDDRGAGGPGIDVVEIGCGDGRLTSRYADRARSVVAIDSDEQAVALFRALPPAPNVDVRVTGVDRLELGDRSVDVVLLSWSL